MAGVPPNFQAISNVLANYDFVDIVSGTGIINLYAGKTVDVKLLSNYTFYSEPFVTRSAGNATAAYVKNIDEDFDVVVNRTLVLKGKIVVNVPMAIDSSVNHYGYVKVILRKYSGGSETDIVSNDSSATAATGVEVYVMKAIDLDIPLTVFKIGDILRITVEGYDKSTGAGTAYISIAYDPMNRTTGWDSTAAVPSKLIFQCPVRLNI